MSFIIIKHRRVAHPSKLPSTHGEGKLPCCYPTGFSCRFQVLFRVLLISLLLTALVVLTQRTNRNQKKLATEIIYLQPVMQSAVQSSVEILCSLTALLGGVLGNSPFFRPCFRNGCQAENERTRSVKCCYKYQRYFCDSFSDRLSREEVGVSAALLVRLYMVVAIALLKHFSRSADIDLFHFSSRRHIGAKLFSSSSFMSPGPT